MTFVITEPCIDTTDQSCVSVCPVDCIHFTEGADRMLYISPVDCIDCGACQPACPVSAIFPEAEVPAASAKFTAINELWYADPAAARAQVGGGAPAAAPATSAPRPAVEAAPAAAAPAAAAPRARRVQEPTGFKYGENGVEGKCAICGQYVIKGGVKFREKSVLCSDDAERVASMGNPYRATPGRR